MDLVILGLVSAYSRVRVSCSPAPPSYAELWIHLWCSACSCPQIFLVELEFL